MTFGCLDEAIEKFDERQRIHAINADVFIEMTSFVILGVLST